MRGLAFTGHNEKKFFSDLEFVRTKFVVKLSIWDSRWFLLILQPSPTEQDEPEHDEPGDLERKAKATARLRRHAVKLLTHDELKTYILGHNDLPHDLSAADLVEQIFAVEPGKDPDCPSAISYLFNCTQQNDNPSAEVRTGIAHLVAVLTPISFQSLEDADLVRMANCVTTRADPESAISATVQAKRPLIGTANLGRILGLRIDVNEYLSTERSGEYAGPQITKGRDKMAAATILPEGGVKQPIIVEHVAKGLRPLIGAVSSSISDVRAALNKEARRNVYFVLWLTGRWDQQQLRSVRMEFPSLFILVGNGDASDLNLEIAEQIEDLYKEFGQ